MSEIFNKCKIEINDEFGRYLVTSENIKSGEILLSEIPTIVGPYWDTNPCCLNCYQKSMQLCKKCKIAPLCLTCTDHETFECIFFERLSIKKHFLIDHFNVVTPLRCLLLNENQLTRQMYEEILKMESHCGKRRGSMIWKMHNDNIIKPLRKFKILEEFSFTISDELIQKICGILDVNTFEVRTETFTEFPIRGLYRHASLLAHNCISNTFITVDNSKQLKIYSSVDITENDIVYNNYTSSLYGTAERRAHLLETKYFYCKCNRCLDPTEFGTQLSSINCKLCSKGMHLLNEQDKSWKCTQCMHLLPSNELRELLTDAQNEINNNHLNTTILDEFIFKYSRKLNSNHYLVIELKQQLAAIIRNVCDNPKLNRINADQLKSLLCRKTELCNELLPILKKLQPGISRLTAIALYEHFTSFTRLLDIQYKNKDISSSDYRKKLSDAANVAKESLNMLVYEPISTPEGALAKKAMFELKEIRSKISTLPNDSQ